MSRDHKPAPIPLSPKNDNDAGARVFTDTMRIADNARSPLSASHHVYALPEPFAPRRRPGAAFVNALLATALFRCWHMLLFFGGWATLITMLYWNHRNLNVQPTLLTVVGTVLGFIISYRTTSSFERYNEGRRLWSQLILANRTFARTIWFHVPDSPPEQGETPDQTKARGLIEKKTAINLLEAFAVAVKHYLRGEDGIYYKDLYYLVKFLPAYALPLGMPSTADVTQYNADENDTVSIVLETPPNEEGSLNGVEATQPAVPPPQNFVTHRHNVPASPVRAPPVPLASGRTSFAIPNSNLMSPRSQQRQEPSKAGRIVLPVQDELYLMPAYMPPKYGLFDLFPFSLLVGYLSKRGKDVKGKKGARVRAQLKEHSVSHNLPLELSLYLTSYVSALQKRKVLDVPTSNQLLVALNQLVESLTGLERILTTPIPWSYSIHLWVVTYLYCLFLPFQLLGLFGWLTIPATTIISFVFFGFMVAGEEIENPFGYDKNDLNLDHFTHNIIRNELRAVTSTPPPDVSRWAFSPENNLLFSTKLDDRVTPAEWLSRGPNAMIRNLRLH